MPQWIYQEPKTILEYANALVSVFLIDAFVLFVVLWLSAFGLLPPIVAVPRAALTPIEAIIVAPLLEEIVFRAAPLWFTRKLSRDETLLGVVIITSSFFFALIHNGQMQLAIQGIGGVLLCALYLKCGGMRGVLFTPLVVVTMYHMIWNFTVLTIVFALSR